MNKNEIANALNDAGVHMTPAHIKSTKKADLLEILESALENIAEHEDGDEDEPLTMSEHLAKYRKGYVRTKSASGTPSMHNGDDVAATLSGCTPAEVVAAAETILGLEPGTLADKYASLNQGQCRMNAGNRIRFAVKRGDVTVDEIAKAVAAL